MQSKYAKINSQKIPLIVCNVFKLSCALLFADSFPDLYRKFLVVNDRNEKYQIWSFCCYSFLTYTEYRHAHTERKSEQNVKVKM